MDDAVAADDVGGDDFGACDGDAAFGGDLGGGAVDRLHVTCLDVFGEDLACDDVIGEDSGELGLVFWLEEFFDGALRELGEGFVGWGEDGEWAFTGEGFGETGGLDCGDEGGEVLVTGGDFDHRLFFVGGGGDGAELEGSGDGGEEEDCFHMVWVLVVLSCSANLAADDKRCGWGERLRWMRRLKKVFTASGGWVGGVGGTVIPGEGEASGVRAEMSRERDCGGIEVREGVWLGWETNGGARERGGVVGVS